MNVLRSFTISGLVIPVIETEPCARVGQYMRRQPVTCQCSACKAMNVGMTQAQIYARMDRANGVAA